MTVPLRAPWDEVSRTLQLEFDRLVESVAAARPSTFSSSHWFSNDTCPLIGTLSFSRTSDPAGDEDVVVSIEVTRRDGQLHLSSDISRGTGFILADGPQRIGTGLLEEVPAGWVPELLAFLRESAPLVTEELERKARGDNA